MIETLYVVLTNEGGQETIAAMASGDVYGSDGPMLMQAVSSTKETAENILKTIRKDYPERELNLVKFVREKDFVAGKD